MTTIETPGFLTFTISILVFFIGSGLNRSIVALRRWNISDTVTGGILVIQNLIAAGCVAALGLSRGLTVLLGSASLIGGHGTTIAWAALLQQRFGLTNAMEVGIAAETLGLVVASVIGGPIAGFLISRNALKGSSN